MRSYLWVFFRGGEHRVSALSEKPPYGIPVLEGGVVTGARTLVRSALLLCVGLVCCAPAASPPATPPASAPDAGAAASVGHAGRADHVPGAERFASVSALADEAVRRVLGAAKPGERIVILPQFDPSSPVAAAVKAALEREPRVAFSVAQKREVGPVDAPGTATGHVNAVEWVFEPRPALVVMVGARKDTGLTYVAARDAGPDPLGPSSSWTWTLEIPTPR